ncbi:MAG TPA: entry exclusion 1 domain-containing protein [Alphaproteobacteria bacterium]|nr:entry exclusion 1 domain-containing protein [Alphaproteobacteria bacterium]
MAKVGPLRAAELTGKSKSTIQRAMMGGKLSYEVDNAGRRVIDVSELERVFGLGKTAAASAPAAVEQELEKAAQMIEMERMKMRIKMLEEQLYSANQTIDDLKSQRDKWQKQADQVLLTSQYSQKQAEELREEIKERERRAVAAREERKKQFLEERMRRLKGENQNAGQQQSAGPLKQAAQAQAAQKPAQAVPTQTANVQAPFNFQGLWKRVKGS